MLSEIVNPFNVAGNVANVAVAAFGGEIFTNYVGKYIAGELVNNGAAAVADFQIWIKRHQSSDAIPLFGGADFDIVDGAPSNPAVLDSDDPGVQELPAGQTAQFAARIGRVYSVILKAKSSAGSIALICRGSIGD